jgi:Hemolysin coregulated protein Hcp (TssD)
MSFLATLNLDGKKYNVLAFDYKASQQVDNNGKPSSKPHGFYIAITVQSDRDSSLSDWMVDSLMAKDGYIRFYNRDGMSKFKDVKFETTYCVGYKEIFEANSKLPMRQMLTLSSGRVIYGNTIFEETWARPRKAVEPPIKQADDENDEKIVILSFDASTSEVKSGKFGFDKFDPNFKKIYTGTDFTKLENEYNPIQVYGEKYFPVWVSMRKGQTITLDLDFIKRKNYKLYKEITFDPTNDFTFDPPNLKDAKKVKITCNNTNPNTTQINIEGDGETVGAINFFYPEPKEVNVRWVVVNFNRGDQNKVLGIINNKDILKEYFKKAFNPTLIDIKIINSKEEILDITIPLTNPSEQVFIDKMKTNLEAGKKDSVKQDDKSKTNLMSAINTLHQQRQKRIQTNEITLYLTNLKSSSTKESPTDSDQTIVSSNNGATIGNVSLMYLGNENKIPKVEIPHEIMHALGLQHTFKKGEKHVFDLKSTKNYMDYNNPKETTFCWQWQQLH